MTDPDELRNVIDDLIDVLHLQAEELQRLLTHVEQETVRIPYPNQVPLVLSQLSELHHRVRHLAADGASETGP